MIRTVRIYIVSLLAAGLFTALPIAAADDRAYTRALEDFRNQSVTAPFFRDALAYVVLPRVYKAGLFVGGAYGKGRAYQNGAYVGNVAMGQASVGWQFGGQAYSEIIFFQNEDVFAEFRDGSFQLGADASAVALTAGAQVSASTKGATASAGASSESTGSAAQWYRGMAVFTLTQGGLMVAAAVGGQVFDYKPLDGQVTPAVNRSETSREQSSREETRGGNARSDDRPRTIPLEPLAPEESW